MIVHRNGKEVTSMHRNAWFWTGVMIVMMLVMML